MNRYKYITVDGEILIEEFRVYGRTFRYEITNVNGVEHVKVYLH